MQINSVSSNTPQFKALKISNNVKPLIEKESVEYVKSLQNLGERVKDFAHYDVVFKDNLTPKIFAVNADINKSYDYYRALKSEEKVLGQAYQYGDEYETHGGWYPDQPRLFLDMYGKKEAKEKYNEFKKLVFNDRIVEYCRMLNEQKEKQLEAERIEKAAKEAKLAAEKAKQEAFQNEVSNLYENYGYIEPEPILKKGPSSIKPNPETKKEDLLNRIKNFFNKF